MSDASCSLLAPWYTYRMHITQMPRRRRDQCKGIIEWYCAKNDQTGSGQGFGALHVYDYFCKNAAGTIVTAPKIAK